MVRGYQTSKETRRSTAKEDSRSGRGEPKIAWQSESEKPDRSKGEKKVEYV